MNRSSSRSSPARCDSPARSILVGFLRPVGIGRRRLDERRRRFEHVERAHDERGILIERLERRRRHAHPVLGRLLRPRRDAAGHVAKEIVRPRLARGRARRAAPVLVSPAAPVAISRSPSRDSSSNR